MASNPSFAATAPSTRGTSSGAAELGTFDDRSAAIDAAKELVRNFGTAEESGDWPELNGRFLRPASVASIDVLVA